MTSRTAQNTEITIVAAASTRVSMDLMVRHDAPSVNRPIGLLPRVLGPFREAGAAAQAIVRVEQLCTVADVEPLTAEPIAVDRRARVQPGKEVPGLVR